MDCPSCGHDNIEGVDLCEDCHQPLVHEESTQRSELERVITRDPIDVVSAKKPVTILPSTSVREAVDLMNRLKIGCVLVLQDETLVGVFTERDVLNRVSSDLSRMDRPVAEFMTSSPVTLTRRDSIAYALHAMNIGGYRHMPVIDDRGQPRGILSIRDVMRFLCTQFTEIRA